MGDERSHMGGVKWMRCEYITALVVILLLGAGFVFSLNLLSSDDSAHELQGHLQQLRFAINSLKQETAAQAKAQPFGAETTQALVKRVDELAVSQGLPIAAPEPTPAAVVAVPAAAAPAQKATPAVVVAVPAAAAPAQKVVATPATPVPAVGNNRVLCIMMAGPVKPQEVENFWTLIGMYAEHCDGLRISCTDKFLKTEHPQHLMDKANKSSNVIMSVHKLKRPESIANLWEKTYTSFAYSYLNELDQYGWFVGLNTDAIIIAENLNRMRDQNSWDPDTPYYLGHRLNHEAVPFNAGGCYILSRGALRKVGPLYVQLITGKGTGQCRDVSTQAEDVFTGQCLKQVGVSPLSPKEMDSQGRDSFFNFRLKDHHQLVWAVDWFWKGKERAREENCCSDYPIQDHNFKDMREHIKTLTKLYDSPSFKATGFITKQDWLNAEGCAGLGKNTKWASRSECP